MVFVLVGCATPLKFPSVPTNKPQAKYTEYELIKYKPVTDGTVGYEVHKERSIGLESSEPKKSIWRRIWSLGIIWVVLMILGLFFPPVAIVMGLFNRAAGAGTKNIVRGIEKALDRMDIKSRENFKKTLSEEYDDSTKKLVSKLKRS